MYQVWMTKREAEAVRIALNFALDTRPSPLTENQERDAESALIPLKKVPKPNRPKE